MFRIIMKLIRLIQICVKETPGRIRVGNYFCEKFAIRGGLKHKDA